MNPNIRKMILDYNICNDQKQLSLASRSLDYVSLFINEIRAVYQYLFDDSYINQLLIDVLSLIPIGENEDLKENESFSTFEIGKCLIPKEIVLPKITSSLQSLSLIGECARIMKNQNPKEEAKNEIILEFLKTLSSYIIKQKTKQNENLANIFKYYQIQQLKTMLQNPKIIDQNQTRIETFLYMLSLMEEYKKYPKEVLNEIKQVLITNKTTNQILEEGNINLDHSEEHVYRYLN